MIYLTHMSEKEILDHAKIIDEIIENSPFSEKRKESLETAHQALKEIANTRHNGYTNYPTWLLAAYMDNTEEIYNFFCNLANQVDQNYPDELSKVSMMIQSIKEWIESKKPETKPPYKDLLDAVIETVDFKDIAADYLGIK